ncbi:hypoxia-inducbile protein, putative [Ixodes scapularis]|uniref:Hypoxia-inducbile protein, putative n=2 Tax=Ixodes scapularis TaxID=6945 RepID=B7Q7J4_IXOSC|nr:hypoxia-inducbile protein, putative [Ixodes scapularis]|eukprot:XP_002404086.1 hypoxia-inducbile protein, putative [Ixodes scapularis]
MTEDRTEMATPAAIFEPTITEETTTSKLKRKYKESPFMVFGLTGCLCACAYGAYMYRRRKFFDTSVYMMQLRVAAQGTVVGFLTLGVSYSLVQRYLHRNQDSDEDGTR